MYKNKLKIIVVFILVLSFGFINLNGVFAEDKWGGVTTHQSNIPSVTSDGMSQSYASQNVEVRKDLEKVEKNKKAWDITKTVMGATAALGAGVAIAGFVAPGLDQNARTAMIAAGLPVAAGAGVTAFVADGQSKELRRKSLNLEGRIEDNWDAMTRNAQVNQDVVFADTMKQGGFSNSSTNAMHAGAVEDIYFGPAAGGNVPNQNGNASSNTLPNTPPTTSSTTPSTTSKTTTKSKSKAVSDSVTLNVNNFDVNDPKKDSKNQCCFLYYGHSSPPTYYKNSGVKHMNYSTTVYYYVANCSNSPSENERHVLGPASADPRSSGIYSQNCLSYAKSKGI